MGEHDDAPGTLWPRQRKWLMAPHQWKWPLMEILPIIKAQRQMAGQMTMSVWHLLTQRDRRYQSDVHNQSSRLWRRELHKVGAKAACVDAAAAYVDVAEMALTEGGRTR